jgi:hypothetical protein
MSLLKTLIRKDIQEAGGEGKAIINARDWYVKAKQDSKNTTLVKTNEKFKRGKIYMFKYTKPKNIENIKYWDANPVVLSMGQDEHGNDIGINLNFLPNTLRLKILDKIMESYSVNIRNAIRGKNKGNAKSQYQVININYSSLVKVLYKIGFNHSIRSYITNRKSQQFVLSYDSWPKVTFLNIKNINKGLKK